MPVALIRDGSLYSIHPDHLGTPRIITDSTDTVVWRWESDPFGNGQPEEDADNDGVTLTYNLRFPGQYYDGETGKYYNYFRDYDPTTGRYVQSDPIGLDGGLNTYAYVGGNPLGWIDLLGLASRSEVRSEWNKRYGKRVPNSSDPLGNLSDALARPYARPTRSHCVTPECAAGLPPTKPPTWPENVDFICWSTCRLKKVAICQGASLAGAGIGATAGAVLSIPSGGGLAPVLIPVAATTGSVSAWFACTANIDLKCMDKCKKCK